MVPTEVDSDTTGFGTQLQPVPRLSFLQKRIPVGQVENALADCRVGVGQQPIPFLLDRFGQLGRKGLPIQRSDLCLGLS